MQLGLIQNLSGSFKPQYPTKLFAAQGGLKWMKCWAAKVAPRAAIPAAALVKRTGFIEEIQIWEEVPIH